jgi:hypothetical protein
MAKEKKAVSQEKKETNIKLWAGALVVAVAAAGIWHSSTLKTEDKRPKVEWLIDPTIYDGLSESEQLKARRQVNACAFLDRKIETYIKSWAVEGQRDAVIREFFEMLTCAERGNLEEFTTKYEDVCVKLDEAIQKHPRKGLYENRVWNPFYKELFEAICKIDVPTVVQGEQPKIGALRRLQGTIKDATKNTLDKAKDWNERRKEKKTGEEKPKE